MVLTGGSLASNAELRHQHSPDGDVAVVHLEADDLSRALTGMGTSEDPFDRWLRQLGLEIHGVDLKAGFPPIEQVLDFHS